MSQTGGGQQVSQTGGGQQVSQTGGGQQVSQTGGGQQVSQTGGGQQGGGWVKGRVWTSPQMPGRWQSVTPSSGSSLPVAVADLEQRLKSSGGHMTIDAAKSYVQGRPSIYGSLSFHSVLNQARTARRFWTDTNNEFVATREAFLQLIGGNIEARAAREPPELAELKTKLGEEMVKHGGGGPPPMSVAQILSFVLGRNKVKQHGGYLVPAHWSKEQLAIQDNLRARAGAQKAQANEVDDQGQRRFDQTGQGGGWAVVGMLTEEHHHDQSKKVTYYDDFQREQMVLTLKGGQFVDATGRVKRGPDHSQKDDGQVLNSNARAATVRYAEMAAKKGLPTHPARGQHDLEIVKKIADEFRNSARLIFVMDAGGRFFAAEGQLDVIHHSSFLGAGAVAAAGELGLSGGKPTVISNESGHYQPGPAYIWQAVLNLKLQGVDVSSLKVELNGVKGSLTGAQFLALFDPTVAPTDPRHLSFDRTIATAAINKRLGGKP